MIKKHLKLLIITSVVILLPVVAGLLLWGRLPEQIPTHWNVNGEIDGWSSKAFAVFGLPLILLTVHWLCVLGSRADPKKQNHSEKMLHIVCWIIPVISVFILSVTYAVALGAAVRMEMLVGVFVGLVLAIIGNYMPKCKQNYTIGIKLPWTLNSEENWNRTHRLAGRLWLVSGVVIILSVLLDFLWVLPILMLLMILVPLAYSYMLYRKGI